MYKSILSGAFHGMESFLVQVEADISDGLPCMDMIGYLSSEVKETRERVRVGIKNSGYQLPVKRITINLSPADVRKGGSAFDLPVALALLAASGQMDEAAKWRMRQGKTKRQGVRENILCWARWGWMARSSR